MVSLHGFVSMVPLQWVRSSSFHFSRLPMFTSKTTIFYEGGLYPLRHATFMRTGYTRLRPKTLLKKRLWHKCFAMKFAKCLRRPFVIEHLGWVLLTVVLKFTLNLPLSNYHHTEHSTFRILLFSWWNFLTLSWRRPLSYRNQSISVVWFLYDNGLRHERVKRSFNCLFFSKFRRTFLMNLLLISVPHILHIGPEISWKVECIRHK